MASKIPPNGSILPSNAPSRGLWMPELVLYGIRLLVKQFLGSILDIEVDQSGAMSASQRANILSRTESRWKGGAALLPVVRRHSLREVERGSKAGPLTHITSTNWSLLSFQDSKPGHLHCGQLQRPSSLPSSHSSVDTFSSSTASSSSTSSIQQVSRGLRS